jgi:hypothetical protein
VLLVAARQATAETKLEIGVRSGYALPFGKVSHDGEEDVDSRDFATGQVPLWFDIGLRAGPRVFFGAYLQYGVGVLSDEMLSFCHDVDRSHAADGGGASCNVHDFRLGAQVHYHFGGLGASLDPWVGAGFGYEWASVGVFVHEPGTHADLAATLQGFEFINAQAGLDVAATDIMAVGPFVALTFGSYERLSRSCYGELCTDDDSSESVGETALHYWLFFGLRVEFVP